MKIILHVIVLIIITLNVYACDDPIDGLNKLNIANDSDNGIARYGSDNKNVYYIKNMEHSNLKYCEKVFVYNLEIQSEEMFFDPLITADNLTQGDSIAIENIFNINEYFIAIVSERKRSGQKTPMEFTTKKYYLDKDTGYIIKVEIIDNSNRIIYGTQSTINRDLITEKGEDCFFIMNSRNDNIEQYKFSDNIVSDFYYTPDMIGGRNEDEIIMSYNPAASRHGSSFTQIAIKFYSIEKGAFTKEVLLSSTIVEKTIGNSVEISLSPSKDKLLLYHSAYGFWIYNIDTGKINTLIVYDYSSCLYEIGPMDWSWDGKKILLNSNSSLYELDIAEFIESHPEGLIMEYE